MQPTTPRRWRPRRRDDLQARVLVLEPPERLLAVTQPVLELLYLLAASAAMQRQQPRVHRRVLPRQLPRLAPRLAQLRVAARAPAEPVQPLAAPERRVLAQRLQLPPQVAERRCALRLLGRERRTQLRHLPREPRALRLPRGSRAVRAAGPRQRALARALRTRLA